MIITEDLSVINTPGGDCRDALMGLRTFSGRCPFTLPFSDDVSPDIGFQSVVRSGDTWINYLFVCAKFPIPLRP
ncbi:hypothetical protein HNY73_012789 [Argiope bruennichi]|uniref:Uncharacterized protein n=1 Tax=Argiope bruennichi TaxID=94029 RepID=A0A8T0EY58_ARGBR|nr:hypothetical protein HNY73_012789 [Argiope bruennichi]